MSTTTTSPVQRWILDSQRELLRRLQASPADNPARAGDVTSTSEKV